ncbi:hypothetical protein B0J15DRAFT_23827 [Fusarium solani]|uniref:Uncharacterized protein n=1 Tax=Fusarium solani TaxID=169388 RepID=A0A9P9RF63_FUSSL|nr:uncharacterized protein B0J15DRAFT_23827 [Fusarium solani]KAH7275770.1 hypothetical protein B0J15DRAFT_23827 [Fusarium solani]
MSCAPRLGAVAGLLCYLPVSLTSAESSLGDWLITTTLTALCDFPLAHNSITKVLLLTRRNARLLILNTSDATDDEADAQSEWRNRGNYNTPSSIPLTKRLQKLNDSLLC